jgi:hypothetical protein
MKNCLPLLAFICLFHSLSVPLSLAEEPYLLIGKDYYQVIKDNLSQAKEEIMVVMYFVIEDRTSKEDIETFILFIQLIQRYGYQSVLKANEITAKYKKGSGLFNITTTINTLRSSK